MLRTKSKENELIEVSFEKLPQSLEDLKQLLEASLNKPHYAVALLIPALHLWSLNQDEAIKMINYLKGPKPLSTYDINFISERLKNKEYTVASYFTGAIPENNYEPSLPYTVLISVLPHSEDEEGYIKYYMQSNGADSLRPVQVRLKPSSGQWFLWEQMLLSEIRPPVKNDDWA